MLLHTNTKGASLPAHPHSPVSNFVIRFLESVIAKRASKRDIVASFCSLTLN